MAAHPIDATFFAKLTGDATLMALATGGVYRDLAPGGAIGPIVIVKLQSEEDLHSFGGRRPVEDQMYSVDAINEGTSGSTAQAMADRIDVLLDHGTLTITGYTAPHVERIERFGYVEAEGDERWQHRGGIYRVQAVKN